MLEQVILNLAVNARDAMPKGGMLTIGTRNEVVDESSARALEIRAGDHVVLAVSDTGSGMDETTRSRVFEPFFTTKPLGKGTGLGLATVFGIVKQSAGGISVQSRPGQGSEFNIYLPRVRTEDSQKSLPPMSLAERGTETVLVVEDDMQVQAAVCRLLAARGYHVLRARGPRQALDVLVREGSAIDVLLTDVVMPEMDGRSLAARAAQMHPEIKVVFMSGHAEHPAASSVEAGPDELLVRKPFSPQQLTRALRLAIDSDPHASA
jgi:CheY-like chemotaxis protein